MRVSRQKVELLMAVKCLNPKDIVAKAGISYPALVRAYAGRSKPSTIGKIARALDVEPDKILNEEESDDER